jgi:5-methylcytosine-specific restriction endonuclease McrA
MQIVTFTQSHEVIGALDGAAGAVVAARLPAPSRNGVHTHALVLNASMEPLCVVPTRRAIVLVLSAKADLLHAGEGVFRAERTALAAPSVVRLRRYVHVPYRRRAALSRRGVFLRDHGTCQYCGRIAENVDHVVPRSRGGQTNWANLVTACSPCNLRKADRLVEEAKMALRTRPRSPGPQVFISLAAPRRPESWERYLAAAV